MSFVLPQVALQRVIQIGLRDLREDKEVFFNLFAFYDAPEMRVDYGAKYIEQVWKWFQDTKTPVVQAWSFNPQKMPLISIHLAQEQEDETKAAIGDFFGHDDFANDMGTGVFSVMLDIGIHANREGDEVLWLYYIVGHVLFRHKRLAEQLGLRLQTFSASDYNKEAKYMADNIWTRWIRFKCTVENYWIQERPIRPEHLNVDMDYSAVSIRDDYEQGPPDSGPIRREE